MIPATSRKINTARTPITLAIKIATMVGATALKMLETGFTQANTPEKSSRLQYCAATDTVKFEDAPINIATKISAITTSAPVHVAVANAPHTPDKIIRIIAMIIDFFVPNRVSNTPRSQLPIAPNIATISIMIV